MFTYQALQILIFLIPGFIASIILDILVVRNKKNDLSKVIEALSFTLVIFAIFSAATGRSPLSADKTGQIVSWTYDGQAFIWLIGISIVIPVILSFLDTHDYYMGLARWLTISKKTARTSVWVDLFYDLDNFIIVNFEDERRIYGWPKYFSTDSKDQFIYLWHAQWIEDDEYRPMEAEGVLVTPEMRIESIEVLKNPSPEGTK